VSYLRDTLGVDQVGWRDMIVVRAPNEVETVFFKLPDDGRVPVIETRRTTFDSKEKPVRLTVSVYPGDRNQFAVNVGQVPGDIVAPPVDEDSEPDPAAPGPDTGQPRQPAKGAADN
jgi:hypothetical protein